jgi:N-methylhydantoinase A
MNSETRIFVGMDSGGTFTDIVCYNRKTREIKAFKVPSTPEDPAKALLNGLLTSGYEKDEIEQMVHGTTIASNAIVERDESSIEGIAYLTTKGFEDIPFIQRIDRKSHYDLRWDKPDPLVKRTNTFGVSERISYKGEVLKKIDLRGLKDTVGLLKKKGMKSVALCFLFSYINPEHERIAEELLKKEFPELFISVSSRIYPKWKEYERSTTTLADAFLKPILNRYSKSIRSLLEENRYGRDFAFMKTNGGLMSLDSVEDNPVHTLNSGPAAGVVAASNLASQLGLRNVLTVDIGGTTCDISAIVDSSVQYITSFEIEYGLPIQIPMVDVNAIGAGGGSVVWIDKGGGIQVGPQSMGSDPGPVCYDRGNKDRPTLTDACLVLGYLNPERLYGSALRLRRDLSERAIGFLGEQLKTDLYETASSIFRIVNSNTARAIDVFMARRGLDPRDFSLFGFGGSGPMHVAAILKETEFQFGVIPPSPGAFSAFGLLQSDPKVDFQQAIHMNSTDFDTRKLNKVLKTLEEKCLEELRKEGYSGTGRMFNFSSLEMRYFGQNYELDVPVSLEMLSDPTAGDSIFRRFHELYETEYGYKIEGEIIEVLNVKLTLGEEIEKITFKELVTNHDQPAQVDRREAFFDNRMIDVSVYDRDRLPPNATLKGPSIIEEETSTTVLETGVIAEVGKYGALYIKRNYRRD